jgi:DNA-binding response OmpR family regulator
MGDGVETFVYGSHERVSKPFWPCRGQLATTDGFLTKRYGLGIEEVGMHTPPRILVVDDQAMNVDILKDRLTVQGYEVLTATDGEEALSIAMAQHPDLILLDIIMLGMDGHEVCRRLKSNPSLPLMPIIMITAKSEAQDIVAGFQAGADEYLTKPLDQAALVARIEAMLRLKSRHDVGWDRAAQLESQAAAMEVWGQMLEDQIQDQVAELERMGRLKQFVLPELVERFVSPGARQHALIQRRDVTILCCVLHGFTRFVDAAAPEVVFDVLGNYHQVMRRFLTPYEGIVKWFSGNRLLVVFNALLPCPDAIADAVHMALSIGQPLGDLRERWHASGPALDFGIGIAYGDATLGLIELEGRLEYTVMGSVRHLASRLGEHAQSGHVLVSEAVWAAVEKHFHGTSAGHLTLQGQTHPVSIFQINNVKERD